MITYRSYSTADLIQMISHLVHQKPQSAVQLMIMNLKFTLDLFIIVVAVHLVTIHDITVAITSTTATSLLNILDLILLTYYFYFTIDDLKDLSSLQFTTLHVSVSTNTNTAIILSCDNQSDYWLLLLHYYYYRYTTNYY